MFSVITKPLSKIAGSIATAIRFGTFTGVLTKRIYESICIESLDAEIRSLRVTGGSTAILNLLLLCSELCKEYEETKTLSRVSCLKLFSLATVSGILIYTGAFSASTCSDTVTHLIEALLSTVAVAGIASAVTAPKKFMDMSREEKLGWIMDVATSVFATSYLTELLVSSTPALLYALPATAAAVTAATAGAAAVCVIFQSALAVFDDYRRSRDAEQLGLTPSAMRSLTEHKTEPTSV